MENLTKYSIKYNNISKFFYCFTHTVYIKGFYGIIFL